MFQIASKTGDGVFEAAKENGFYAIGVDSDQKYIADDVIICSMMKQVATPFTRQCQTISPATPPSGAPPGWPIWPLASLASATGGGRRYSAGSRQPEI